MSDSFRAATLANNIVWLRSFGSEVVARGGRVDILSSPVPRYVSTVVFNRDALREIVDECAPLLFIDMAVIRGAERHVLQSSGYARLDGSCSAIVGGVVRATTRQPVGFQMIAADDWRAWSDTYSEAFEQSGVTAAMNRERWRTSFDSPELQHWFFVIGSERVGVCQTVHSHGVVGLYSVGILPRWRSVSTSLLAIRTLHRELSRRNERKLYFEVALRPGSLSARAAGRLGLKVIRKVCGYAARADR
jgi:hypothetical protein